MKYNLNPAVIALIYALASYILNYASIMFSVYRLKKELINESILYCRMPSFIFSFIFPYIMVFSLFDIIIPDIYKINREVMSINISLTILIITILYIFSMVMILLIGFSKVIITDKKIILILFSIWKKSERIVYLSEIKSVLCNPSNNFTIIVLNDDSTLNMPVSYKRIKKIEKFKELNKNIENNN